MPNYKETDVSGKSWQRCKEVIVTNPLAGDINLVGVALVPKAVFVEEEVVDLAGLRMRRDVGSCELIYVPGTQVPLLNPLTGQTIGSFTHDQFQAMLFSLYIQSVTERDTKA